MKIGKNTPEELAQDFVAAEVRRDTDHLKRMMADDFVSIGPRGVRLSREAWLRRFESGDLRYSFYSIEDFDVRVVGDAAVVTALNVIRGHHGNRAVNGHFRSSHVWVRQAQRWRLVLHQLTAIVRDPKQVKGNTPSAR